MSEQPIGIGLIGCGTVGQGVLKLLHEQAAAYAQRIGRPIEVRRVLVRDASRQRDLPTNKSHHELLTTDPDELFNDERISIVAEVAGGTDESMVGHVRRALQSGRHVITANKALLASNGRDLFALAHEKGVSLAFEASCGGGIPILSALKFGLAANRIEAIYGILNGTCNYILTQMTDAGTAYRVALEEAQLQGYAEADPTLDVSGADAAQKLAIIASLAYGAHVHERDVTCRGIENLWIEDIRFGAELGYRIKLLAIAEMTEGGGLALRVQPCFIDETRPLSQVHGSFNALSVFGHAVGHTLYYGHGAGQMPTASAVVGDLLNVAAGWYPHAFRTMRIWPDQYEPARVVSDEAVAGRHYLRIDVKDEPHVLSRIAAILGNLGISIAAVLQHESDDPDKEGHVPLVITTHAANEAALTAALDQIADLDVVRERPACIRIVEPPPG